MCAGCHSQVPSLASREVDIFSIVVKLARYVMGIFRR